MSPEKQKNLDIALKIAWEKLATKDMKNVCEKSGAHYLGPDEVTLPFLDKTYLVNANEREIRHGRLCDEPSLSGVRISPRRCVLLLHYLLNSLGASPTRSDVPRLSDPKHPREIGFAQIPGAIGYLGPFRGRVVGRIVGMFGEHPEAMLECSKLIGGRPGDFGDVSVVFSPFPKVVIIFVLWLGDEEFPPDGNVLFNETVHEYLSVEDVVVTCEEIIGELSDAKKRA